MNAEQNLYKLQMERFEVFELQNPENDDFDVVFEIKEKKIYAHKFMLSLISPTFKAMLSERWSKNETIKLETYSFEDFKEFLTFIYSGKCQLTEDNIAVMIDMAEFYGVEVFKEACNEFLKTLLNLSNIAQLHELANKFKMIELKNFVNKYIAKNLSVFLESKHFQNLPKSLMKEIVELNCKTPKQEEMFRTVCKWAENHALQSYKLDKNVDLKEIMMQKLSDILPFIKFELMDPEFLNLFVAKKSFVFPDNQFKNILLAAQGRAIVKLIDKNGKEMKGELRCFDVEKVVAVIQSQKNVCCNKMNSSYYYWNTKQPTLSTPSKLTFNKRIDWYLLYDSFGDIAIKHRNVVTKNDNYLLAEMFAENGFHPTEGFKIDVSSFA